MKNKPLTQDDYDYLIKNRSLREKVSLKNNSSGIIKVLKENKMITPSKYTPLINERKKIMEDIMLSKVEELNNYIKESGIEPKTETSTDVVKGNTKLLYTNRAGRKMVFVSKKNFFKGDVIERAPLFKCVEEPIVYVTDYIKNRFGSKLMFGSTRPLEQSDNANTHMAVFPDQGVKELIATRNIDIGEELTLDYTIGYKIKECRLLLDEIESMD